MPSITSSLFQTVPSLRNQIEAVQQATTLSEMILMGWQLGLAVALLVIQEVLRARAQAPITVPLCPKCGKPLWSKGFGSRQLTTLLGVLQWERRVYRCSAHCPIGQVAPLDQALGLEPHQETGVEVKQLACAFAVFVPFETAAALLKRATGLSISPGTIWGWVQVVGARAMQRLNQELEKLAEGQAPEIEPDLAQLPLLIGSDGVMVPFRSEEDSPKGRTVWREVKIAILARLKKCNTNRDGEPVTRLERRRLVAVLGDIEALIPGWKRCGKAC